MRKCLAREVSTVRDKQTLLIRKLFLKKVHMFLFLMIRTVHSNYTVVNKSDTCL